MSFTMDRLSSHVLRGRNFTLGEPKPKRAKKSDKKEQLQQWSGRASTFKPGSYAQQLL
jgi:hypothetical protein